ncbi:MAG: Hpt domain-containing protein [Campylobacterota bacterium]|nr:Hpt domain-containing protein [Campylobacterota bacterium]
MEKTKSVGMNFHLNKPIDIEKLYQTLIKYIPKKIDVDNIILDKNQTTIPKFNYINSDIGLSHMDNNNKLYIKVLNNFKNRYRDIKLEDFDDAKMKRTVHTLKGLSANIGAMDLHNIIKELEENFDNKYLSIFYKELNNVICELETLDIFEK